jgi:predicted  nucleic acid-binding Zn-ribbon protein
MFMCERCGSRYSAMHAVAIENCPRCQIREQIASPLAFKAFELHQPDERQAETLPLGSSPPESQQVMH